MFNQRVVYEFASVSLYTQHSKELTCKGHSLSHGNYGYGNGKVIIDDRSSIFNSSLLLGIFTKNQGCNEFRTPSDFMKGIGFT